MKRFIISAVQFFRDNQSGSMAVEAVFVMPMLFWAATATFTFYDAFKVQNATYRANYTISDMLSRKTDEVDQAYVDGLHTVFRYMTNTGEETSWIRISLVRCTSLCADEDNRVLVWDWSKGANGARELDDNDLIFYRSKIPLMAFGSRLIFVEASREYNPPFANALVSFAERDLVSNVATRPRFVSYLCWETCIGLGGIDGEEEGGGGS